MSDTITNKPAAQLLVAINALARGFGGRNQLHVYAGTVPTATVAKRRAANKQARKARRASR
jgi:hypothetical protein